MGAKQWRPVTYCPRAITDTESRYSQLEKEAKGVEWGIANQIHLYGMEDTFEVDSDHKPLVALLSGYRTTAQVRIERIRVHLEGFNYHLNYIVTRKEGGSEEQSSRLPFTASRTTGYTKEPGQ